MAYPSRSAGLALAASLAAHALIPIALFRLPGPSPRAGFDTRVSDTSPALSLSLTDPPERPAPATGKPRDVVSPPAPDDLPVTVQEPSVPLAAPAPPAPVVVFPARGSSATAASVSGSNAGRSGGGRPSLLEAPAAARRVVYVLDRSLSMGPEGALGRARQELLASLARLPAGVSFQVILYNRQCEPLRIGGRSGFLPADQPTREALARELDRIAAAGNTDHFRALQTGLRLGADVLYLVTDSDDLSDHDVQALTRQNGGRTAIHAIELNRRRADADGPLQRLATQNGGTFRQVPPVE